jgi:hypothetical protein
MILKMLRALMAFFLPVSEKRRGQCIRCGECCRIVFRCPFLKRTPDGGQFCGIYSYRFPSCRKYPRAEFEWSTPKTCGFYFLRNPESVPGFKKESCGQSG